MPFVEFWTEGFLRFLINQRRGNCFFKTIILIKNNKQRRWKHMEDSSHGRSYKGHEEWEIKKVYYCLSVSTSER